MSDNFTVWYKPPKTYERIAVTSETEDSIRTTTTTTEDILKDKNLRIPISCYIHPRGLQDLIQETDRLTFSVAVLMFTGLHTRTQNNCIEVSIEQIAQVANTSTRSVNTAIRNLIELGYIEKKGKQVFRLSPKLCWFGNQVDWARELKDVGTI